MGDRAQRLPALPSGSAPQPLPAGFEPTGLDPTLRKYVTFAEENMRLLEVMGPKLSAIIERLAASPEGPTAIRDAEDITLIYDRMSKAGLNIVRALDELSRLRSFLAGGPDSRPDLSHRGEHELRTLLLDACEKLGFDLVARVPPPGIPCRA